MCNPFVCMNDVVVSPCYDERRVLLKMAVKPSFNALFEIILKKVVLEFELSKIRYIFAL